MLNSIDEKSMEREVGNNSQFIKGKTIKKRY